MSAIATREHFATAHKASIETFATLTNKAFAQFERLSALNVNAARSALEDSLAAVQSLQSARSPQDLIALQASLAQPMLDKAIAYGRSVQEITAEAQQEISKLFEAQVAEINKTLADTLERAAKTAPAGSEPVFAAIKSAMALSSNVYDSVSKATKQVAEVAEANVTAATEATVEAVKATSAKTTAAAKAA